jgi:sulfonate transport system ATP-binding protein
MSLSSLAERTDANAGLPSRPPAASVAVRNLFKSFDGKRVLRGLDLDVAAGQFVAIVGRSGCGKSTLLRMIADLETPDTGQVTFAGAEAASSAEIVRVMFQEPRLLPWASVLDNVEVGLGPARREPGARARALEALEALEAVGLADRAKEWPSVLSGGQKQRVALARALISRPRVLALDEPLGALDALTRIEMQSLLETAWRREGFTALLVTHDVGEAVALADRIVVIEGGVVAADVAVDLPRPRKRESADRARLEASILGRLLGGAS